MKLADKKRALATAVEAARTVGALMKREQHRAKTINSQVQHDIKLELDVRSQAIIEKTLYRAFPEISVLGEEGNAGDQGSSARWVVDPIDGTVNFAYGIPHACVSIALQLRQPDGTYRSEIGVVYDPFCDELWTALRGQPARLNNRIIRVSQRQKLAEAIVTIGFAKSKANLERTLPYFNRLAHKVRKVRIMGAAALALTYVASGRFDAYVESGVRLWDIAAAGLILECAGGDFFHEAVEGHETYRLLANNGLLRRKLQVIK